MSDIVKKWLEANNRPDDPLLVDARKNLLVAVGIMGDSTKIVQAVEDLISVKITLAIEAMADRVQEATGARP